MAGSLVRWLGEFSLTSGTEAQKQQGNSMHQPSQDGSGPRTWQGRPEAKQGP